MLPAQPGHHQLPSLASLAFASALRLNDTAFVVAGGADVGSRVPFTGVALVVLDLPANTSVLELIAPPSTLPPLVDPVLDGTPSSLSLLAIHSFTQSPLFSLPFYPPNQPLSVVEVANDTSLTLPSVSQTCLPYSPPSSEELILVVDYSGAGDDAACVDDPRSQPCQSLETALLLASLNPHHTTVLLSSDVVLTAPTTLISLHASSTLVITSSPTTFGAASRATLYCPSPSYAAAASGDACLMIKEGSEVALRNVIVAPADPGQAHTRGLLVSHTRLVLENVDVSHFGPVPYPGCGGLMVTEGGHAGVFNSSFRHNSAGIPDTGSPSLGASGGAICVLASSTAEMSSTVIASNTALRNGGGLAIHSSSSVVLLSPMSIAFNSALGSGGGISVSFLSSLTVGDGGGGGVVVLESNHADGNGGGLGCFGESAVNMSVVEVVSNDGSNGGGVYGEGCDVTLRDGRVAFNVASESGGGLYFDGTGGPRGQAVMPRVEQVEFAHNRATARGGGVFSLPSILDPSELATVTFTNNSASQGSLVSSTGMSLVILENPVEVLSGALIPFEVAIVDALGEVVSTDSVSFVAASLADPSVPARVIGGAERVVNGVASFGSLQIQAEPTNVTGNAISLLFESSAVPESGYVVSSGVAIVDCAPGLFVADEVGFVGCSTCRVGTFSDSRNSLSCDICPAGYVAVADQTGCAPCGAGTFSSAGDLLCRPCPLGSASNVTGTGSCTRCFPGTFAPDVGTLVCETCPAGSYANTEGATDCIRCETGSYTGDPTVPCTPCDTNVAVCEGDAVFSLPGYYMFDPESFGACDTDCEGGNRCKESHTGELCASCVEGYMAIDGECKECTSGRYGLAVLFYAVVPMFFLLYIVFFTKRSSGNMQVIIFFGQTMALILENLPRPSTGAASSSWGIFNMDLNFILGTCLLPLSFYGQTVFKLCQPIIFFLLLGILYVFEVAVYRFTGFRCPRYPHDYSKDADLDQETFQEKLVRFVKDHVHRAPIKDRYYKAMLGVALFTYTPTMRAILTLMRCRPPHPNEEHRRLLAIDLSIECKNASGDWDPVYFQFRILAMILCVVYVYALPALLLGLVFYIKRYSSFDNIHVENRYSTLFSPYEPQFFYWGPFMQYRKTILVSLTAFVNDADVQRLLFVSSLLFFASIHLTLRPYEDDINDVAETMTLIVLLFMSTMVVSHWIARPETNTDSADLAILVVTVVAAIGFVAFVAFLMYAKWKMYSVQKMEEKAEEVEQARVEDPDATCSSLTTEELDVALGLAPIVRVAPKYVVHGSGAGGGGAGGGGAGGGTRGGAGGGEVGDSSIEDGEEKDFGVWSVPVMVGGGGGESGLEGGTEDGRGDGMDEYTYGGVDTSCFSSLDPYELQPIPLDDGYSSGFSSEALL